MKNGILVLALVMSVCMSILAAIATEPPAGNQTAGNQTAGNQTSSVQEMHELPIGKEISVLATSILSQNSEMAKQYIFKFKEARAQTSEQRLQLIQSIQDELEATYKSVVQQRKKLIEAHRNGTLDDVSFATEMRKLASQVRAFNGTIGAVGKEIADLNKQLSGNLRDLVKQRVQEHKSLMEEFRSEHRSMIQELHSTGYKSEEDVTKTSHGKGESSHEGTGKGNNQHTNQTTKRAQTGQNHNQNHNQTQSQSRRHTNQTKPIQTNGAGKSQGNLGRR